MPCVDILLEDVCATLFVPLPKNAVPQQSEVNDLIATTTTLNNQLLGLRITLNQIQTLKQSMRRVGRTGVVDAKQYVQLMNEYEKLMHMFPTDHVNDHWRANASAHVHCLRDVVKYNQGCKFIQRVQSIDKWMKQVMVNVHSYVM